MCSVKQEGKSDVFQGTYFQCLLVVVVWKMSPSATENELQRAEESVSVKMARGGARCDVVSLPLSGEDLGGSVAKVTALSKWSSAASLREHELAMVQSFRWSPNVANVVAGEQSVGNTPCTDGRAD